MATSMATRTHATVKQRSSRKSDLRARIRKNIRSDHSPEFIIGCVELDVKELMQIAMMEGIKQGVNQENARIAKQLKAELGYSLPIETNKRKT